MVMLEDVCVKYRFSLVWIWRLSHSSLIELHSLPVQCFLVVFKNNLKVYAWKLKIKYALAFEIGGWMWDDTPGCMIDWWHPVYNVTWSSWWNDWTILSVCTCVSRLACLSCHFVCLPHSEVNGYWQHCWILPLRVHVIACFKSASGTSPAED